MERPIIGGLLVICTTEFSSCLNIALRDKGLEEEEIVLWVDEVLDFIRCCCATAVDGSISPFNGIIINPVNSGCCKRKSFSHWFMLRTIHQIYSYASSMQIRDCSVNLSRGGMPGT